MIEQLTTKDEFREAMRRDVSIVIKDNIRRTFHATPSACGHVDWDFFITKVIDNKGKNGGYFAVGNFDEAEARWPSVVRCE